MDNYVYFLYSNIYVDINVNKWITKIEKINIFINNSLFLPNNIHFLALARQNYTQKEKCMCKSEYRFYMWISM